MQKFSPTSLRSRAIILVLLAILPLFALTLYSYFDQRDAAIREVQRDELVAVRNLATVQETLISETQKLLMSVAQLPQVQRLDREGCNVLFAKLMEENPHYAIIAVTDAKGQLVAGFPSSQTPVNYADRLWFQKAVKTMNFSVGEFVAGRVSKKFNLNLAYPIIDDAGRLQGVITAAVDVQWLGGLLVKSNFPPTTAIVLTDSIGKALFRYPEPWEYSGKPMPDFLVKIMAANDEGQASGIGLPGDQRLFAFTRLAPPWQEMRLIIGLPRDWAVAPVNRTLWRNLTWMGLVALLAMSAAWFGSEWLVVRPVRVLRRITEQLAAGDLSVRAGPDAPVGELGLLAHDFDQMATALQEREKALKGSRRQAAFLADLLERSSQPFAVGSPEGGLEFFNSAYAQMLGCSNEELRSLDWSQDLTPPEWEEHEAAQLEKLRRTGQAVRYEKEYLCKDGTRIPIELLVHVRPAKDGQPALYYSFITDITERKHAEESLRESKERLAAVTANLTEGLIMADGEGRVFYWNPAALDMFGYASMEECRRKLAEFADTFEVRPLDDDRPLPVADWPMSRVLRGEVLHDWEIRIRRPDQHWEKILAYSGWLIRSASGETLAFISVIDVTERKRAEEALRESRAKLQAAFGSMTEAIFISDAEGRLIDFNDEFVRYHRFRDRDECSRTIADCVKYLDVWFADGTPAPLEQWAIPRALRGEMASNFEYHLSHKETGETWWGSYNFAPIKDDDGKVIGAVVAARDITKRKQAEEVLKQRTVELERSNRELENFAYISSHDMQEPLRQIANFSEILAKEYSACLDERAIRYFNYISAGASRMQALIIDLLAYSSVDQPEIQKTPVSLEAILQETLSDLQTIIRKNAAEISADPLPTLKVNPNKMGQVLQNLINNAIKFHNEQPPRIHLSARQESGEWVISIRDNGIGFNQEYAEEIFKVFKRMHSQEKYTGTGIGLAICKKIVERHGGRIWAESQPGQGATFYFTIPA